MLALTSFLNSTITAAQLETDLRSYAREFEARPYKVAGINIDWSKLPQDVLAKIGEYRD